MSLREVISAAGPAMLLLLGGLIALHYVDPAPPKKLTMLVGRDNPTYQIFAQHYRESLAEDGVALAIESSSGSASDLARLCDRANGVDLAFLQDGLHDGKDVDLVSLGSIQYEPIWFFTHGPQRHVRLTELEGMRVAIGEEGSGTRVFARHLLDANHINVSAMHLVLPHGAIDLRNNVPPEDLQLLATTVNVVAREAVHPALVMLLVKAMRRVHQGPGLLHREHDFPADRDVDFDLSPDAARFYRSGPPFMQRYLPFWLASLVDRFLLVLLPLLAVLIRLARSIPTVYRWKVKNRIYRWYGELKFLEIQLRSASAPEHFDEYLSKVEWIDERVNHIRIPLGFSEHFYILKEHIELVRNKVLRVEAAQLVRDPGMVIVGVIH